MRKNIKILVLKIKETIIYLIPSLQNLEKRISYSETGYGKSLKRSEHFGVSDMISSHFTHLSASSSFRHGVA